MFGNLVGRDTNTTDRQTDRQTDRHMDGQKARHTLSHTHTHTHIYIYIYIYTYTLTHTPTKIHTHRHMHTYTQAHIDTRIIQQDGERTTLIVTIVHENSLLYIMYQYAANQFNLVRSFFELTNQRNFITLYQIPNSIMVYHWLNVTCFYWLTVKLGQLVSYLLFWNSYPGCHSIQYHHR